MGGADYRMQQEQEEQSFFLWSSLNNLRDYLSPEVFRQAERELGFSNDNQNKGNVNGCV